MTIESEIFKSGSIDFTRLLNYGFIKEDDIYCYSKELMKNFQAQIFVDLNGVVSGKIYDLKMNDEYTNFRIDGLTGFASVVREKYVSMLKDIAEHVLVNHDFIFEQSNRIEALIKEKYQVTPEFLWDSAPGYGVFRNSKSNKWFAIIINVDKSKVIHNLSGEIEILNLKLDNKISEYINQLGIYPAYHMSKKSWVSIILDDTLSDEDIMKLVDISYHFTNDAHAWVIPANPKCFDIISLFQQTNLVTLHQNFHVNVGDYVYIYLTQPYQAILFGCEVIEANIFDQNSSTLKSMKLQLIKQYDQGDFSLDKLKQYGLKSIRSARKISHELNEELQK